LRESARCEEHQNDDAEHERNRLEDSELGHHCASLGMGLD
jgi:hypothetical protein